MCFIYFSFRIAIDNSMDLHVPQETFGNDMIKGDTAKGKINRA